MSDILEVQDLSKSFGRKTVLENFNLSLNKGKIYGLLGMNGTGKTTFVRMIMGIIPSDKGAIIYKGREIKFNHSAYKREIGYIPEDPFFYGFMTVSELLNLNSSFYPKWNKGKADEYLERLSLERKSRIDKLSRGMKLKLGLIVALASEPEFLILDDPTSGIDVPTRQDFMKDMLVELCETGVTVLFATHLVHELERIVDHLCILHGGKLIVDEDYQKVKDQVKKVALTFADSIPEGFEMEGVLKEKRNAKRVEIVVYPWNEEKERKIEAFSPVHREIESLSMEDIFSSFVSGHKKND